MALGPNDFDGGKSITRAIGRGGIFRAHTFQWPFVMDIPAPKSLRPAPYKNRYINSIQHIPEPIPAVSSYWPAWFDVKN
jgi:hypothetical protein